MYRNLKFAALFSGLLLTSFAYSQSVPRSSHVWVIGEENHSYEQVIGNSGMPYYNQLANKYGLATQFYSTQHSSLPALMWYVAGAAVETNNDTTSCKHTQDNIIREVLKAGYSWRSYQENMPYAGYQGLFGGTGNTYFRRHNPVVDFTDVCPGTGQDTNSVPFDQMATDFDNNDDANFVWITPDADQDAHNASLELADQWLQDHVPAILARPEFQSGGDGILFIVWDEGHSGDDRCSSSKSSGCGGRTAPLVIGPGVKSGFQSTTNYHSENVLKTVCVALGLSTCPGAAQDAQPMAEFFGDSTSTGAAGNSITISAPTNGESISGTVHVVATVTEDQPVSQTQVWDNGKKLGVYGTHIDQTYKLAVGKHTTTVIDLNKSFKDIRKASVTYEVKSLTNAVQIVSPSANQTISNSSVHVVAQAQESQAVSQIEVWDNGVKVGTYSGSNVDQYIALEPGSHTITVEDFDSNSNLLHKSTTSYTVQ